VVHTRISRWFGCIAHDSALRVSVYLCPTRPLPQHLFMGTICHTGLVSCLYTKRDQDDNEFSTFAVLGNTVCVRAHSPRTWNTTRLIISLETWYILYLATYTKSGSPQNRGPSFLYLSSQQELRGTNIEPRYRNTFPGHVILNYSAELPQRLLEEPCYYAHNLNKTPELTSQYTPAGPR